jgi:hypothetical protein
MRLFLVCLLFSSLLCASSFVDRDPFQPQEISKRRYANKPLLKSTPKVKAPVIKVTGIIWEENSPMAVVSYAGRQSIISPGDKLFSNEVTKISKKAVWLKGAKKTFILEVGKEKRL